MNCGRSYGRRPGGPRPGGSGAGGGPARRLIASTTDPPRRARAHQALGIALRDQGRSELAVADLRQACRWARRAEDDDLLADVRATLGITLVFAGRPRDGLRQLDDSVRSRPEPRALLRRGVALNILGSLRRVASRPPGRARRLSRRRGPGLGGAGAAQPRAARAGQGPARGGRGAHPSRRRPSSKPAGKRLEMLWAQENLGEIAYAGGDLPGALTVLDDVAREYDELGHHRAAPRQGPLPGLPGRRAGRRGDRGSGSAVGARADVDRQDRAMPRADGGHGAGSTRATWT